MSAQRRLWWCLLIGSLAGLAILLGLAVAGGH
jgi:hypothetical protein